MGPPNTELWESAKLLQKQISMDDLDQLTLTDLPSELLIHICSFLQANFVHDTLSKVSVLFHQLILNDTFWKVRIGKSLRQKYPPIAGKKFTDIKMKNNKHVSRGTQGHVTLHPPFRI